jgi:hypothetical protein
MRLNADYRNVADYLACLGFFEVASWSAPSLRGDWTDHGFELDGLDASLFQAVISAARQAEATQDVGGSKPGDPKESPVLLKLAGRELPVNAWLDASLDAKSVWSPGISGQVSALATLRSVISALQKLPEPTGPDQLFAPAATLGAALADNHCPQFRFDGSAAWTTLDNGFSINDANIDIAARPYVEFFGLLGAQAFFPQAGGTKRSHPRYWVWHEPLPIALARLAARGALPCQRKQLSARWLEAGNFGAFSYADELIEKRGKPWTLIV